MTNCTAKVPRYDMPAMFGASLLPAQSEVKGTTVAAISFETERSAAATLLPKFFEVSDPPVVSFTYINYPSLEYLGGRGYQEVVVAVSSVFRHPDGDIKAGFAPVMWVDQAGALISGREFMGFGKLLGALECVRISDQLVFRCREYDDVLVEGEVSSLTPLSEEALARINRGAAEVNSFGWKYIASDGEAPDADYPLVNVTRWSYKRAWSGEARLNFGSLTTQQAPLSARIIATLARLPVVAWRRSFVAEGDVVIDRSMTRRLPNATPAG